MSTSRATDSDAASQVDVAELRHALSRVHAVLDRNRIWHCLMFGTLLGAVREQRIIPWDHDIDLLARPDDLPRLLAAGEELAPDGLRLVHARSPAARLALNPFRVPSFDQARVEILRDGRFLGEFFLPSLFSDGVLRIYDFENEIISWPESSFAAYFVERLRTVEIDGEPYLAPAESEALLGWLYGEDWRIPRRSVLEGGEQREGENQHAAPARPRLAEQIAWCEARGWDRSRYAGQPVWPRRLRGAGPAEGSARTAQTSGSAWWHSLEEISRLY